MKTGVFPAFIRFDTQKTTSRFAPLCFWGLFLHFYTVFTSLLNCTHVLTRKKRAHRKPRRAPGAKMLQSGSRELPCALAFSLVKNDEPYAAQSLGGLRCRFLRVKTCVRHEKHVKTVQKCMPEAPEAYVLQIRSSAFTRCDVPYTPHNFKTSNMHFYTVFTCFLSCTHVLTRKKRQKKQVVFYASHSLGPPAYTFFLRHTL